MKYLIFFLALLASNSILALPNFDPFADATANGGTSYAVDSPLAPQNDNAGNNWQLVGSVNPANPQPMIVAGNLSYANLPPSKGNSVSFGPSPASGQTARLGLNLSATPTIVYYSFILKVTDLAAVPTTNNNNFFAGFSDTVGAQSATLSRCSGRLVAKRSGAGYLLGIGKGSTASEFAYDATVRNLGDVLFVAVAYERVGLATNVNLWVNPPSASFGSNAPPAANATITGGSTAGEISANSARAFVISCQTATAPSGIIDELRIATNWAYVSGGDPAILVNPVNRTVPPGGTAIFSVTARGTPPLTYQWVKDGTTFLSDGGNISGATTASLTVNNVSAPDVGAYSVLVTNGTGDFAQSSSASLSIMDPAITAQPQSRTNDFGTTATFQVTAAGTAPFSFQWHKIGVGDLSDGGNISGSKSNVLTLTAVAGSAAGTYFVTVTNALGAVDSSNAVLTVKDPLILSQPASLTNVAGSNVTFSVSATGTAPLSYQWKHNSIDIFDGGNISGATTDTLNLANISSADEGLYSVVVSGPGGSDTSSPAALTVLNPAAITAQPNSRTVLAGSKVVFAVGASGTFLTYQWRYNGNNLAGATGFFYSLNSAQPANAGNYSVIVSNSLNSVTSSVAVLTIAGNLRLFNTNLVVVRVGDGAQTLATSGNSVFLDQFTPAGNYVNTVTIPDQGGDGIIEAGPDLTGSTLTGTELTRSADKRFLVLAGYRVNIGNSTALQNTTSTNVPRAIGLIDAQAQYTLAIADTNAYSDVHFRGAASDGIGNFWGCGSSGGTYYFGAMAAPATIQATFVNTRSVDIFNGDLYCLSSASGGSGLIKFIGLPTTDAGTVTNLLSGFSSANTTDFSVDPTGTLIYLTVGSTVQKWQFDGATWTNAYTLAVGATARYLTVDYNGVEPVLYLDTADGRLMTIVDSGSASTAATLVTAGVNQLFKGVRFGPSSARLSATLAGSNLILNWEGSHPLQSSLNVTGTFNDVPGPVLNGPYTNSTIGSPAKFFRLRN